MVVVLLAKGFEEIEALTAVDLLRRAELELQCVGVTDRQVGGGHGIELLCDTTLAQWNGLPSLVILPGGMPGAANLAASPAVTAMLKAMWEQGKTIAAICAAPAVVLEPLGILKGRRCTSYPSYRDRIKSTTPLDAEVVKDGALITAAAAGCATQFALCIIEHLKGGAAAQKIARSILAPYNDEYHTE